MRDREIERDRERKKERNQSLAIDHREAIVEPGHNKYFISSSFLSSIKSKSKRKNNPFISIHFTSFQFSFFRFSIPRFRKKKSLEIQERIFILPKDGSRCFFHRIWIRIKVGRVGISGYSGNDGSWHLFS